MATERTPILGAERRSSLPFRRFNRDRTKWLEICRCCCCTTFLALVAVALVSAIVYAVRNYTDNNNPSNDSVETANGIYNLTWPLEDKNFTLWRELEANSSEIESAIDVGLKSAAERESRDRALPEMDMDSPSFKHQLAMKTSRRARELSKLGLVMEMGTREWTRRHPNVTWRDRKGDNLIGKFRWNDTEWVDVCNLAGTRLACTNSPYRTADGSCNNVVYADTWGVAMRPFRRVLPPDYSDGISSPRNSSGGLPPAREVSLKIHRPFYAKDFDFTVMLAVWGQFVDHDMTATALSQGEGGKAISCCGDGPQHPECFAVRLGPEDPFYDEYNVTCMEFVRSAPAPSCDFGPREQLNQASSFIDGSVVYGNDEELMRSLRTFHGGELKMLTTPSGEELLPVSTDVNDGCNREEQFKRGRYCFQTGDLRSNENLHLVSMHLIFARQHNSIARKLSQLNKHWSDEKVFQESRKILTAQIQHITYNEFLPAVLPRDLMQLLNLTVSEKGYFRGYNASVNPTIANSFAASVFRFGHSLLPGLMKLIANDSSSREYMELHKMLFNPFRLYDEDFLETIFRGAMNSSIERSDVYFNREITENLFRSEKKGGPCGLDLVTLNIQRGRDHGLPGYPQWRVHCGLQRVTSFDDLRGVFDEDSLSKIKDIYESVDDVDLFTGGLAEIPINGSLLGPTFTCLLADQFLRLKIGDRFWYESPERPQAFRPGQLREIRKTSLARIVCDNTNIAQAQPRVMRRVAQGNRRKSCRKLPTPNLNLWREHLGWFR